VCPGLPTCSTCQPIDCRFAAWGDWYGGGGCTGLAIRQRGISNPNNECGTPCSGPKVETKAFILPECTSKKVDCEMGQWSSWSACTSPTDQKKRSRQITTVPSGGGNACVGDLHETAPCGARKVLDCKLSDWGMWTECSATCGGGYHAELRRVLQHAGQGGKPCSGTTRRTFPCNTNPCGVGKPCIMGAWNEWEGCDMVSPSQKYRKREVEQPSENGGRACNDVVKEVTGCISHEPPVPCKLSAWSDWAQCEVSCDGGQTYRERSLETPPSNGGSCHGGDLHETKPCGMAPCHPIDDADCKFSQWKEWSACSNKCGTGVTTRIREVVSKASSSGLGCEGPLSEAEACESHDCSSTDCQWSHWESWSACTCTCGGGTKRRTRIVKTSPTNGGKLCDPIDKAEIEPCNTQSCEHCIDGSWMQWDDWSGCSATCGVGYQSRHREVALHPNQCGKPAVGLEDEFKTCLAGKPCIPDADCQISEWLEWSSCSCSCFGVKERHRTITRFASGNGKPCSSISMKQISQCNPSVGEKLKIECGLPPPRACVLASWSDWGNCSAKCDGGQRTRTRHVLTPADADGTPCNDALSEIGPCKTEPCEKEKCVDCEWGLWSEWGSCSKCGGQRYRHRSIVQMANVCGKACQPGDAKETSDCHSPCSKVQYCSWSDWSAYTSCAAPCGPATRLRQRTLSAFEAEPASYLFQGNDDMICAASQLEAAACEFKSCKPKETPKDCQFGQWSSWQEPTCTQICERQRVIEVMNNHGGTPCDGPLVETKRCLHNCTKPVDCEFSEWKSWSECKGPDGQRFRSRKIVEMGSDGGKVCQGLLKETIACTGPAPKIIDCSLTAWTEWSTCSQTCGGGVHMRNRKVDTEAQNGGQACIGSVQELKCCLVEACHKEVEPCKVGPWTHWGDCSASHQKYRERKVLQEGKGGGDPCDMPLKEIEPCTVVTDCVVSEWTGWDVCDRTCGGGQQQRHRQVVKNPENGGKQCPSALLETQGCNRQPCGRQDCEVDDWSEWGACPVDCGSGQQSRSRVVSQLADETGVGCKMPLFQTRSCLDKSGNSLQPCPHTDCLWGDWSGWSSCSCDCDGGQRSRDRHIKQTPGKGGKPCDPLATEEIQPCNTQKCKSASCIDGRWDNWEHWTPCSATCKGGLTWRTRKVLREANYCGTPVKGLDREIRSCHEDVPCNPDVDCKFTDWSAWSDCTKKCTGVKRRSRRIAVSGRGAGKYCLGDLKQTAPCNPGVGEDTPHECSGKPPQDCKLSHWQEWSGCSATCGGGQQDKAREILQEAENGGKSCAGPLSETRGCGTESCVVQDCDPVDCKWGDWDEWSACDKCGGEKKRFRHIMSMPACGGAACEFGAGEEATNCTRKCHEPTYCTFGQWSNWGSCSADCGNGVRSRERHLHAASITDVRLLQQTGSLDLLNEESLQNKYDVLAAQNNMLAAQRFKEIVVAFACGLVSLVLLFAAYRSRTRTQGFIQMRMLESDVAVSVE